MITKNEHIKESIKIYLDSGYTYHEAFIKAEKDYADFKKSKLYKEDKNEKRILGKSY